MPVAIVPETGTGTNPAANSYGSLADAVAYYATVIESASWDEADDDTKAKAIVQGARTLDYAFEWEGRPTSEDQPMQWPRRGVPCVSPDKIPKEIRMAQFEIGLALLVRGGMNAAPQELDGSLKTVILGNKALEIDLYDGKVPDLTQFNPFTPQLLGMLAPFGYWTGGTSKIRKVYR